MSRWTLTDPATSETYVFELSPGAGGDTSLERPAIFDSNVGPLDTPLVMAGQQQPREETATGILLTQAQYLALGYWYSKGTVVQLTDQLNRTNDVIITEYAPKRVYSASLPWRHSFTLKYQVMD